MPNLDLIVTLTGSLTAALALGYVTHRLGLSPIVGYLLAGIVVGPHTPGFVADRHLAEQFAEIGVILLMFGVGLHFQLRELWAVRRVAIPGALVQSLVATGSAALIVRALGWEWTAGLVFGLCLSVASTVVLVRVLADHRDLHTPTGHVAVGWLVVEDLFTVVILVLLPALAGGGATGPAHLFSVVGRTALLIGTLVGVTLLVGDRLIPWLLERVAATGARELFTLTVLVLALGIAVGSAKVFGVSVALGAFLAGLVVGRSDFSLRAASEALPMRDAFAVLFFVSVGMLVDPGHLLDAPALLVGTLAVILIGKPLAALGIVLLLRYPVRLALAVAVALAQIGEFSFLLALLGTQLGILPAAATHAVVTAAVLSITINPLLYRLVEPAAAWWSRRANPAGSREEPDAAAQERPTPGAPHRAVIVGYGPVGRTVARLLRDNAIEPVIVELNLETVRRVREQGLTAVYGDARQRDVLQAAGVAQAGSLILSASAISGADELIRLARELNPTLSVLARATLLQELAALHQAGAELAFSGEGEVALALTEAILHRLGATPDQIDSERQRVHTELFGQARRGIASGGTPSRGDA
jgi:CPA2 family monovalent cation:H+ antiporter-2